VDFAERERFWLGDRAERLGFALFAGAATLWVACRFYASMRLQLGYTGDLPLASKNDWSAPLDDVFIHFDFARAIARGHLFEWSEGNGYSSGGTSLLYPFVLAFGYWAGLRKLGLVVWAAVVACVSTFALILAGRCMFRGLPRYASWLLPPAVLCVGALDWTLFSGMEVAFFLAVWAGTLIAFDDLVSGPPGAAPPVRPARHAAWLGVWGGLCTLTRPEAVIIVAVFALAVWILLAKRAGFRGAFGLALLAGAPALAVTAVQALMNLVFTGEATAAGAIVKLELESPFLTRQEVWDAWLFHSKYQLYRVAEYHLTDVPGYGWIPFGLALFALLPKATRRYALLLLASAVSWVLLIALNGQVRWQNERYTMPALAWLLMAAALGTAALVGRSYAIGRRGRVLRGIGVFAAVVAVALFVKHQAPRFRDQIWFFGRASRNIRDQHIRVGRLLRDIKPEPPHRVLLSDAGAIPYASDLPALDLIGLGGYHGLPFARATREGVGAAVELMEHVPPGDRPDVMALYPSWWGIFPLWFGDDIGGVPVTGNVICGGAVKVLYRARWDALDGSGLPSSLKKGERIADEIDIADLTSERVHGFSSSVGVAHVEMKLLPNPQRPSHDLFDAGRILPPGATASFRLTRLSGVHSARMVFRLAPAHSAKLRVSVDGREIGTLELGHEDGFIEPSLALPADVLRSDVETTLEPLEHDVVVHHVWVVDKD
jgi:hypothetical protein